MIDWLEGTNQAGINPNLEVKPYLWCKKAIGCGASETFLRWIAFCGICKNYRYKNTKIFVTCGPREKTAIELVKRLKDMLRQLGSPNLIEESDRTICKFADLYVQTVPSDNLNSLRGWTDISIVISDEADFYSTSDQITLREILESMPAKFPNVKLILLSSPNLPGGLFDRIEHDENAIYHKIFIPYTRCVGKIYTEEEIEVAHRGVGFERNFNLQYGHGTGTVFRNDQLNACVAEYDTEPPLQELWNSVVTIAVDPGGFGSTGSKFGVVSIYMKDDKIYVLDSIEHKTISFEDAVQIVVDLARNKFGYYQGTNNIKIFCDKQFPSYITALKKALDDGDYMQQIQMCRDSHLEMATIATVSAIGFEGGNGKNMLFNLQSLVNSDDLRIHPMFENLIMQMRIAKSLPNGALNKKISNESFDALDCLQMCTSNILRAK